MTYKGFTPSIRYVASSNTFEAVVVNASGTIAFTGSSIEELEQNLKECVDAYLKKCQEKGIDSKKTFSGKFLVRIGSELHQRVAITAAREGESVNAWVSALLEERADTLME